MSPRALLLEVIPSWCCEKAHGDLREVKLFRRNKVSLWHKVKACILYMAGLSIREIAYTVHAIPASREAVGRWFSRPVGLSKTVEPKVRATWP